MPSAAWRTGRRKAARRSLAAVPCGLERAGGSAPTTAWLGACGRELATRCSPQCVGKNRVECGNSCGAVARTRPSAARPALSWQERARVWCQLGGMGGLWQRLPGLLPQPAFCSIALVRILATTFAPTPHHARFLPDTRALPVWHLHGGKRRARLRFKSVAASGRRPRSNEREAAIMHVDFFGVASCISLPSVNASDIISSIFISCPEA